MAYLHAITDPTPTPEATTNLRLNSFHETFQAPNMNRQTVGMKGDVNWHGASFGCGGGNQMGWRNVSWTEYCQWLTGKLVVSETIDSDEAVIITFSDGSQAIIESNYDHGYSEYTPGFGLQPPSVRVSND